MTILFISVGFSISQLCFIRFVDIILLLFSGSLKFTFIIPFWKIVFINDIEIKLLPTIV